MHTWSAYITVKKKTSISFTFLSDNLQAKRKYTEAEHLSSLVDYLISSTYTGLTYLKFHRECANWMVKDVTFRNLEIRRYILSIIGTFIVKVLTTHISVICMPKITTHQNILAARIYSILVLSFFYYFLVKHAAVCKDSSYSIYSIYLLLSHLTSF